MRSPHPPTGISLRGDVSLVSPAANVKGEASVNFNPVTQEFSGGGSGEIQVNGPGGDALSRKVSLDVQPDGEIKFTDSNGGAIDLGGRKLSVTPSQPAGDGTRSAPSFRLGLAGGPADDKGLRLRHLPPRGSAPEVPASERHLLPRHLPPRGPRPRLRLPRPRHLVTSAEARPNSPAAEGTSVVTGPNSPAAEATSAAGSQAGFWFSGRVLKPPSREGRQEQKARSRELPAMLNV